MGTPFREPDSFIQMTPELRQRLERTVDSLVELLDALDGDVDEEYALGWSTTMATGECDPDHPDREQEDYPPC